MIESLQEISSDFLFEKLKTNDRPVLINTLSRESFRTGHIPGSISIPAEEIEKIEDIVPYKNSDIVVYCAGPECDASTNAAEKLLEFGYRRVWDYNEGIKGWKEAGFQLHGSEAG